MNTPRTCLVVALFLLVCGTASGQYIINPVWVDGDDAPGGIGVIDNVNRPNVNASGVIGFKGDLEGWDFDDFLMVDGVIVAREGDIPAGEVFPISYIADYDTWQHINSAGDYVYKVELKDENAVPYAEYYVTLYKNGTKIVQEGDVPSYTGGAPVNNVRNLGIADDGTVGYRLEAGTGWPYVEYLVYGSNVLAQVDSGPAGLVGGTSILASSHWTGFENIAWNSNGDLIMEGRTDYYLPDSDYGKTLVHMTNAGVVTVLMQYGDTITVPGDIGPDGVTVLPDFVGTIGEGFTNLCLTSNGYWCATASLQQGGDIDWGNDNILIADTGSGPYVVAREGNAISGIPGDPDQPDWDPLHPSGWASMAQPKGYVNSNGDVVVVAGISQELPAYSINERLWLNGVELFTAGSSAATGTAIPAIPGGFLEGISNDKTLITDDGKIYFHGHVNSSSIDGIFEAAIPNVFPVDNVVCSVNPSGTQIDATWDHGGNTYTSFRIFVDGVQQTPDLPGTATTFTTDPIGVPGSVTICVIGINGPDEAAQVCCSYPFVPAADLELCSTPNLPITYGAETIDSVNVATSFYVADAYVEVDITHPNLGDLEPLTITSPMGTVVTLYDGDWTSTPNMLATFSDAGIEALDSEWASDLLVQPVGPGELADFYCEQGQGDWVLTATDDSNYNPDGTMNSWCLGLYEETNPAAQCCIEPTDFLCTLSGACGTGAIDLTWAVNDVYYSLELVRDDGVGGVVTFPLATTDTFYTDATAVFGATYTYTLQYVCGMGGSTWVGGTCTVFNDAMLVPTVTDVTCVSDYCLDEVTLTWNDNGVVYDALNLYRDGTFVANVLGLTSFVDMPMTTATLTYSLESVCATIVSEETCTIEHVLLMPEDFVCSAPIGSDGVTLSWTYPEPATYSTIQLLRDDVPVTPQPLLGDTTYFDPGVSEGIHTYKLELGCGTETGLVTANIGVVGDEILFVGIGSSWDPPIAEGFSLHDPVTGQFMQQFCFEPSSGWFSQPTSAVVGPNGDDPSGPSIVYVADASADVSIRRYNLDGTPFPDETETSGFVLATEYSPVRGMQVVGTTLYFACGAGWQGQEEQIVALDLLTDTFSTFIDSDPDGGALGVSDMMILDDGRMLVAQDSGTDMVSTYQDRIILYSATGENPVVLVDDTNVPGFNQPKQLAKRANGNFVIGYFSPGIWWDPGVKGMVEFDLSGNIVANYDLGLATANGLYELPTGDIACASDDWQGPGMYIIETTSGPHTEVFNDGRALRYIEHAELCQPVSVESLSADATSGTAPFTVNLTAVVTGDEPIDWEWTSGHGFIQFTPNGASFMYDTPGTYTVALDVTNSCGSDHAELVIEVLCNPLSASFTAAPDTGIGDMTVDFNSTCTGDIQTYSWDMDGDTVEDSADPNPSFLYSAGVHTATLTVSDYCGGSDTATMTITVHLLGDFNNDGVLDVADAIGLADYLFGGGAAPVCPNVADINGDGAIDLGDVVYGLGYLFGSGPAPVAVPDGTLCN